jgi:hypothetical protein
MTEPVLIVPRLLAIEILHEAQIAQPEPIRGWISARDGAPAALHRGEPEIGVKPWARLWSNPLAPAVPLATELGQGGLHLVISLNTKGVLEMRAWELRDGAPHERILQIRD